MEVGCEVGDVRSGLADVQGVVTGVIGGGAGVINLGNGLCVGRRHGVRAVSWFLSA